MKKHISLFTTGFTQVFLVSANIYFISRTQWLGIAFCGFGISYLWVINVKKTNAGTRIEQIIYSVGAMMGGLSGVIMAKLLNH
jgi:hypothetical protein